MTNTPSELDKVEQLVQTIGNNKPKQVKITTKFVEISQENNDELGFDWIISASDLSNQVFASGGTIGNQAGRTAADFISPVNGTARQRSPCRTQHKEPTIVVTNGLRSGRSGDQPQQHRLRSSTIRTAPHRLRMSAPGIAALTGLFSDGQVQMIMRGLAQKKGTDLMTAPSVTAKSGQKATIEIIREFIYPTEYEPPELPNSVGQSQRQQQWTWRHRRSVAVAASR